MIYNSLKVNFGSMKRHTQASPMSQTGKFHVHTHRKNRHRRGLSGMDLQSRNASASSDHVVKIADRLGCGVPTGGKNSRRRKIVKIPDSYDS